MALILALSIKHRLAVKFLAAGDRQMHVLVCETPLTEEPKSDQVDNQRSKKINFDQTKVPGRDSRRDKQTMALASWENHVALSFKL